MSDFILNEIKKINDEESKQLSLNFQNNINSYLQDISQKNEKEISDLVNGFLRAYFAIERNRLRFLNRPVDLPKLFYSKNYLLRNKVSDVSIIAGYSQPINYTMNANSAKKASKRTNHFTCRMVDSRLNVEINAEYIADITMTIKELGG